VTLSNYRLCICGWNAIGETNEERRSANAARCGDPACTRQTSAIPHFRSGRFANWVRPSAENSLYTDAVLVGFLIFDWVLVRNPCARSPIVRSPAGRTAEKTPNLATKMRGFLSGRATPWSRLSRFARYPPHANPLSVPLAFHTKKSVIERKLLVAIDRVFVLRRLYFAHSLSGKVNFVSASS